MLPLRPPEFWLTRCGTPTVRPAHAGRFAGDLSVTSGHQEQRIWGLPNDHGVYEARSSYGGHWGHYWVVVSKNICSRQSWDAATCISRAGIASASHHSFSRLQAGSPSLQVCSLAHDDAGHTGVYDSTRKISVYRDMDRDPRRSPSLLASWLLSLSPPYPSPPSPLRGLQGQSPRLPLEHGALPGPWSSASLGPSLAKLAWARATGATAHHPSGQLAEQLKLPGAKATTPSQSIPGRRLRYAAVLRPCSRPGVLCHKSCDPSYNTPSISSVRAALPSSLLSQHSPLLSHTAQSASPVTARWRSAQRTPQRPDPYTPTISYHDLIANPSTAISHHSRPAYPQRLSASSAISDQF